MKRLTALLLMVMLVISLLGCAQNTATTNSTQTSVKTTDSTTSAAAASGTTASAARSYKIAFLVVSGKLGDQALNDACWAGIKNFCNEVKGTECSALEIAQTQDIAANVATLAKKGVELIIFNSSPASEFVAEIADTYPKVRFVIYEGTIENHANVTNIRTRVQDSGFICGAFSTLMNKSLTGTAQSAFIGGIRNPDLERSQFAYTAGSEYVGGKCTVVYLGNFTDAAKAKEITQQMYTSGMRLVQAWAGGANTGIYEAATNAGKGYYAMGAATGQFNLSESIIASMVKNSDQTLYKVCKSGYEGKLAGGIMNMGLADNACGIKYAPNGRDSVIPQEIKDKIATLTQDVISGKIVPPSTKAEYDKFVATLPK